MTVPASALHASASANPSAGAPSVRTATLLGLLATVSHLLGARRVALWTDEAATLSAATRSWSELVDLVSHVDAVHALHSALLHVWTSVAGTSPLALRAPSALATGLAVAGLYVLVARLAGTRTALLAAVVAIVLPRLAWAGIEARSFAFSAAAAVWSTDVLVRAVARPSARRWVAYGLLAAVGVLLNIYGALVVAAHLVTLAVLRVPRAVLLGWFAAAGSAAAVTAPFAFVVTRQSGQLGDSVTSPLALARNIVVNQWFLGETPTPAGSTTPLLPRDDLLAGVWAPAAVLLAAVCWALVGLGTVAAVSRRDPVTAWVLPWLVLPTAVIMGLALVTGAGYAPRYLTAAAPALASAVALGLAALQRRRALLALVCVVALALPVLVSQRRPDAKNGSDWDVAAATVAAAASPADAVYFPVRPGEGASGRSLRALRIAYPDAFGTMLDLTLTATPAASGTLWGTSATLEDSLGRLADVNTLWVVVRDDHPAANLDTDLATLDAAGLGVVADHSTRRTTILELRRD